MKIAGGCERPATMRRARFDGVSAAFVPSDDRIISEPQDDCPQA
ncbi:MAG TPA: hypothetical protein VF811_08630 [Parasulfuritortus sp.]